MSSWSRVPEVMTDRVLGVAVLTQNVTKGVHITGRVMRVRTSISYSCNLVFYYAVLQTGGESGLVVNEHWFLGFLLVKIEGRSSIRGDSELEIKEAQGSVISRMLDIEKDVRMLAVHKVQDAYSFFSVGCDNAYIVDVAAV